MSFTLDQLNALDEAIAGGVLKVKYADKEVEYRSLSDMLRLRQLMAVELGLIKSNQGVKFAEFHSGLKRPGGNTGDDGVQFFD